MTAHDLITDIFSRVQGGPGNVRCITVRQLNEVRRLIGIDKDRAAVRAEAPGVTVWTPTGGEKYVITEDLRGKHHTLARTSRTSSSNAGMLF
jgi:hypothetical protein